jgi:protein transport protein SEC31
MNSQIPRTATFAWSPAAGSSSILRANDPFNLPLLATGTVSGALDASFSNEATLEIWSPFAKDPRPTEVSGLDGVFAAENGAGIERKILASLKTESR